jgi:hypothetical protein
VQGAGASVPGSSHGLSEGALISTGPEALLASLSPFNWPGQLPCGIPGLVGVPLARSPHVPNIKGMLLPPLGGMPLSGMPPPGQLNLAFQHTNGSRKPPQQVGDCEALLHVPHRSSEPAPVCLHPLLLIAVLQTVLGLQKVLGSC